MATKSETFGMVTIEALASGVPVIGSNAGGTPEILEKGKLGILFEALDANDLAAKLEGIQGNRFAFDSRELRAAAQKYDHQQVCKQVEKALGIPSV